MRLSLNERDKLLVSAIKSVMDRRVKKELNDDKKQIELLAEADLLPAVTTVSGKILTDNNGNVILRY